jgi:two-component system CheB/CheR fusion protein
VGTTAAEDVSPLALLGEIERYGSEPNGPACRKCALFQEHEELVDKVAAWRKVAAAHFAKLTSREREIMEMVVAGAPSKNIAADLGISQRTVENHRAAIMRKAGSRSIPALARLVFVATCVDVKFKNA